MPAVQLFAFWEFQLSQIVERLSLKDGYCIVVVHVTGHAPFAKFCVKKEGCQAPGPVVSEVGDNFRVVTLKASRECCARGTRVDTSAGRL